MHRRGHVGVTLLAVAPIAFICVSNGTPLLAVLSWLGIQAVEPLPDRDFQLPGLRHRGTSHSLLAALGVGSVLGASGWLLGGSVNDLSQMGPAVLAAVFDLGRFVPDILLRALSDSLHLTTTDIERQTRALAGSTIDRYALALFGFAIGVSGILVHLLGDVITTRGIQPFLPISRWRISLSPLRAGSPLANTGLFMLGIGALIAAVVGGAS